MTAYICVIGALHMPKSQHMMRDITNEEIEGLPCRCRAGDFGYTRPDFQPHGDESLQLSIVHHENSAVSQPGHSSLFLIYAASFSLYPYPAVCGIEHSQFKTFAIIFIVFTTTYLASLSAIIVGRSTFENFYAYPEWRIA